MCTHLNFVRAISVRKADSCEWLSMWCIEGGIDEVEEGSAQEQDGEHAGRRRRRGGGRCRGAVLSCEQARKQVFGAWMVAIAVVAAVAVRESGWREWSRLTEDEKAVLWP